MKKIILLITFIISLFFVTGCVDKREIPQIDNPDDIYLNAIENQYNYKLTNQRVYEKLKKQVGVNILLDIIDEHLMKNLKKDGISYWDMVTTEMIEEELTEDIFPNGTDDLTQEEIEDERNQYFKDLFINYGLVEEQDVFDYYHLIKSKEMYAEDKLREEYVDEDFEDEEYESYFENNYQKGYYAIIVAYDSIKQYQDALKQLGIIITTGGDWLEISTSSPLNERQIVKAFIDLYNINNSYKLEDYPNQTLSLNQGIEYNIEDDEIVFDMDKIDILYYSHKDITAYQPEIRNLMDKQMSSYPEGDNWYTKKALAYKSGARHVLFMKLGEDVTEFEDVKDEIREKMIMAKLTNTFVSSTFAKLRDEKGFTIYDWDMEDKYTTQVKSWVTHKTAKKGHNKLIASIDGLELDADDLFEKMNDNYGISIAVAELEYVRYIYNEDINKIYNVNEGTVLNKDKWSAIVQDVEDEKKAFKDNLYEEYGYPKSYGWENFLRDFYMVNNEQELRYHYLYQDIRKEYAASLGDLSEATEESELWQFYLNHMNQQVEQYFNVSGMQILISVEDASGTTVDPENWTSKQEEYAEEFYQAIINYLETESGSYSTKMKEIVDAYQKSARFLPGREQKTEAQPIIEGIEYTFNNIEISKYKTAGLIIKYQDLGTFKNGQQPEAFDEVVRLIWLNDPESDEPYLYGHDNDEYQYIITPRGYHVYVNMESKDIPSWGDDEDPKVLPTLEQVKIYIEDEADKSLSTEVKNALSTYYRPIYSELISNNNLIRNVYSTIKQFQYEFHHEDYSMENYIKYIDIQIEKAEGALKYK